MTRHRLSVDIDEELHTKLQKHVPWGQMRPLMETILGDFIHLCERHGSSIIIGAIISEELTLKEFLNKYDRDDG